VGTPPIDYPVGNEAIQGELELETLAHSPRILLDRNH
jgi:hypothetical protein